MLIQLFLLGKRGFSLKLATFTLLNGLLHDPNAA